MSHATQVDVVGGRQIGATGTTRAEKGDMSMGIMNNLGAVGGAATPAAGGAVGAVGAPGAGGPQGAGKPNPMARLIGALKSGDPARIQRAQQFLQKHPEVAQRLQARLNDPATQQRLAQRIQAHGGNPQDLLPKLKQIVDGAAGAAPAAAAAGGGVPAVR